MTINLMDTIQVAPSNIQTNWQHATQSIDYSPTLSTDECYARQVELLPMPQGVVPKVSIIFVARNENEWLRKAIDSLYSCPSNYPFECVVYDDASYDGCCHDIRVHKLLASRGEPIGPSRARNAGADAAEGEFLIFCDGHLKFEPYWIDKLIQPLLDDKCDAVNPTISDITVPSTKGFGWDFDTTTYEYKWSQPTDGFKIMPGMAGGCFAIRKTVFNYVGQFDKGFTKWGMEDSELSLRLNLSGFRLGLEPSVDVGHFFKVSNEYGVDWQSSNYNFLRMCYVNMPHEDLMYVYNRVAGNEADKANLLQTVINSSKFRKSQCDLIRKVSFAEYKEKLGRKMT